MGFIEPVALVFAGLLGVLVLLYLWERWRRRIVVASLLLWQSLRQDTIHARRFRPDLLFLLQLLVLTALVVALARPYVTGDGPRVAGGRHIIVLDTSASMQAREGRSSRFNEARALALKHIGDLGVQDEVMLVTAGHAPETRLTFTRDHAAVIKLMEAITPVDSAGDLGVALAFVTSARQRSDLPTEVDVFTDLRRSQLPDRWREDVNLFEVGESDDNLGIEALQIYQGRFQDYRRARAYVLVQNFSHREGHGSLAVRLEDAVVNRSGFTIPARESRGFVVQDFPAAGRVVAHLEVADALEADNVAFGYVRPVKPLRVTLVSHPSSLENELQELAAATPSLTLSIVRPAGFDIDGAPAADVVIFNRVAPSRPPAANALYLYPPADNALFSVTAAVANIEVLDWNARHPALRGLRPLAALPLQRAVIVRPPEWSEVLLRSRDAEQEFALGFAGEHDGYRVACLSFDLDSEQLLSTDNVNVFLLFMNLLDWLGPQRQDVYVVTTGDLAPLEDLPPEPVHVTDPRGRLQTLTPPAAVQPLLAGEYRISVDGIRQTLLANFFDPLESDIGRAGKDAAVPVRPMLPSPAEGVRPRREIGRWLYYAAAALFLLEWAVARRRAR